MRVWKFDKKLILFTFIIFMTIFLFIFLKDAHSSKEPPERATFVKEIVEADLYHG